MPIKNNLKIILINNFFDMEKNKIINLIIKFYNNKLKHHIITKKSFKFLMIMMKLKFMQMKNKLILIIKLIKN